MSGVLHNHATNTDQINNMNTHQINEPKAILPSMISKNGRTNAQPKGGTAIRNEVDRQSQPNVDSKKEETNRSGQSPNKNSRMIQNSRNDNSDNHREVLTDRKSSSMDN